MTIKCYFDNPNTPWEGIVNVIKDAFVERTSEGLIFSIANISKEELISHAQNSYIFVAYENNLIVGTISLLIINSRNRHGLVRDLAILPTMRNKGLASSLLKEVLQLSRTLQLDFLISDTAVGAYSSVRFHIKNGFKIFKLESFATTNYYSYCFIYPITKYRFLNFSIFRCPVYTFYFLYCHLFKRKDGTSRFRL